jgi:hypothetical protein
MALDAIAAIPFQSFTMRPVEPIGFFADDSERNTTAIQEFGSASFRKYFHPRLATFQKLKYLYIFLPLLSPFHDQQLTHPKHPNSAPKPDSPSATARSSKKQPSSHSPSDSLLFAAQNVSPMMTHLRRFRVVVEPCRW